jgi:hypothetical protein
VYPGSLKNHVIQLAYQHGGSKVNNKA